MSFTGGEWLAALSIVVNAITLVKLFTTIESRLTKLETLVEILAARDGIKLRKEDD